MKTDKLKFRLFTIFLSIFLLSCKVNYNFKSATISDKLKTFSIRSFTMSSAGGPQNMSFKLTEKLKEYYQRNSNMKLKSADGDLQLEGSVINYELTPVSATAGDKAAMNRLTITIEVRSVNKVNEEENFEKEFSFYQDFSQEQTLTQVEPVLVPKILDQLVVLIFNATAGSTW